MLKNKRYTMLFSLCVLSSSISHAMFRKCRETYFKAQHGRISEKEARRIFPKTLPIESQIQFLKLFLHEQTQMKNRKLMALIFAENQLPVPLLFKLLSGRKISHKSFTSKLRNFGYSPDNAYLIRMNLEKMLDQIDSDQQHHKSAAQIYNETMSCIYPQEKNEPIYLPQDESIDDITKRLPSLSLRKFENDNPFDALRDLD
jgi:hypothetical protein